MKQYQVIPTGCGEPFCRGRFAFQPAFSREMSGPVRLVFQDGTDWELPQGRQERIQALCARFPAEQKRIRELAEAARCTVKQDGEAAGLLRLVAGRRRTGYEGLSARQVLEQLFPGCEPLRQALAACVSLAGRPAEAISWEELALCLAGEPEPAPMAALFLGLDCPPETVGLPEGSLILCAGHTELPLPGLLEENGPLILNRQSAPDGAAALCVRLAADPAEWDRLPPEQFHSLRHRIEHGLIRRLDSCFPGLAAHIEERELAVPVSRTDWLCPGRLRLAVNAVYDTRRGAKIFRLSAENGWLPPFEAGQYLTLTAEVDGERLTRPYSISSSPRQRGYYEITVLHTENGRLSRWLLDEACPGTLLEAGCPEGNLCPDPDQDGGLLMLADSRGLMPFVSAVREAVEAGLDRDLVLLYSCPSMETAIFHEQLAKLARTFPNFRYELILSDSEPVRNTRKGVLDGETIRRLCPDWAQRTACVCGEEKLLALCIPQLEALGLPRKKIRSQSVRPQNEKN